MSKRETAKRTDTVRYLKWNNDTIGIIDETNAVTFTEPRYNKVVTLYTHGASLWTPEQFTEFLTERTVSRDRRDIERILFRCGLSRYDVLRICEITRGIHPKDLLWIANDEKETFYSDEKGTKKNDVDTLSEFRSRLSI